MAVNIRIGHYTIQEMVESWVTGRFVLARFIVYW
jgi:hypothetical protein